VSPRDPDAERLSRLRHIADRASLVAAALGRHPTLASYTDVAIAAEAGTIAAAASAVTRSLEEWGWLGGRGSARSLLVEPDRLTALSWQLQGLADATTMDAGPPMVEPVVTLPFGQTLLRTVLGERLDAHATRDGFAHVAACARARLVFLVPFMDTMGADVLVRMLAATPAIERVVVVRPDSRGVRWYPPHLPALHSVGTRVVEYWHPPSRGAPQDVRAETFHAKLALADRDLAYVGSSNMMMSSLDGSLECGVLVRSGPARVFGTLVDAVLAISTPVLPI
jgi:hypothetical protein